VEIPLGVEVLCDGKGCGRSMAVVVNPITDQVTHIVVREGHAPHTERMVPASVVERLEGGELVLKATKEELAAMEPFVETYFIQATFDRYEPGMGYTWPYVIHEKELHYIPEKLESIPPGEVAIHRGAALFASDGPVGKLDEFVVQKTDSHVTHLVMKEGHLWGRRDVVIPVSEVASMSGETVHLKLTRREIGELPPLKLHRKY
jgi:hypothetical protein